MNIGDTIRLFMLPLAQINRALPQSGLIYEIGCGKGALTAYLSRQTNTRKIVGIDINPEKIKIAQKLYQNKRTQFVTTDALLFDYKTYSGVVMSDFLHHMSYKKQKNLLSKLAIKSTKASVLIIKEIALDDGIFMLMSRFWDWLLYPQDIIYYRTRKEWQALLTKLGYVVDVTREIPWFPGSTFLFVCTKRE